MGQCRQKLMVVILMGLPSCISLLLLALLMYYAAFDGQKWGFTFC